MSKKIFTQQEIAPKTEPKTEIKVVGFDRAHTVEPTKSKYTTHLATNKAQNAKKNAIESTRKLTYIATLTAITLLLKSLGNFMIIGNSLKISLTYIGWITSAVILGPIGGAAVGCISDVIGTIISPLGASINPVLTLGYTLFPLIIGLFYKYLPLRNKNISLILGTCVSILVCTLGINSLGLYYMYGYYLTMPFFRYLLTFRLLQVPMAVLNLLVCLIIVPPLQKIILKVQ